MITLIHTRVDSFFVSLSLHCTKYTHCSSMNRLIASLIRSMCVLSNVAFNYISAHHHNNGIDLLIETRGKKRSSLRCTFNGVYNSASLFFDTIVLHSTQLTPNFEIHTTYFVSSQTHSSPKIFSMNTQNCHYFLFFGLRFRIQSFYGPKNEINRKTHTHYW